LISVHTMTKRDSNSIVNICSAAFRHRDPARHALCGPFYHERERTSSTLCSVSGLMNRISFAPFDNERRYRQ
jgi:hypothetical protein